MTTTTTQPTTTEPVDWNRDPTRGVDTQIDSSTCVEKPDKKQKHPHYEHRATKMLRKDNEFSEKKFQKKRRVSTKKKLRRSFKRIARRLNHESRLDMPKEGFDKVCLILINNYKHEKHDPKIGAMNDGYLFGLYHHRLGFKVFYLQNCRQGNYPKWLQFFMFHTTETLTVYYSGFDSIDYGSHGVEFKDMTVSANQFGKLIARDNNGKCKVVFVSDCTSGGSVYDISQVNKVNNPNPSEMLSFYANKSTDPNSKQGRRSHGLLTYYFCKIIYDDPSISSQRMVERLNGFLGRFGASASCDATNQLAMNDEIYKPALQSDNAVPPTEEETTIGDVLDREVNDPSVIEYDDVDEEEDDGDGETTTFGDVGNTSVFDKDESYSRIWV